MKRVLSLIVAVSFLTTNTTPFELPGTGLTFEVLKNNVIHVVDTAKNISFNIPAIANMNANNIDYAFKFLAQKGYVLTLEQKNLFVQICFNIPSAALNIAKDTSKGIVQNVLGEFNNAIAKIGKVRVSYPSIFYTSLLRGSLIGTIAGLGLVRYKNYKSYKKYAAIIGCAALGGLVDTAVAIYNV